MPDHARRAVDTRARGCGEVRFAKIPTPAKITSRRRISGRGGFAGVRIRDVCPSPSFSHSRDQVNRGRARSRRLRTLSSFWKYSRRKEIGFSGRPTHSCTIQSFRTCWILCLCTYSSHSRKLCSSSRFAAILMMHGAPLYRRYVASSPLPGRQSRAISRSRFPRLGSCPDARKIGPPRSPERPEARGHSRADTEGKFRRGSADLASSLLSSEVKLIGPAVACEQSII